ncbi:PREDICTED: syntaxin-binding protein 4-like, partial [Pterocles gutturalis]|uniref:syntaxin-binding protein 4-like n=1 Tax=Pterocles gutturalis TaxID=240206 RepID=UPI000528C300
IKVIGGIKEPTGEEYGVYVKRILPGGVAYADGRLQPGDQILEVNGDSLIGVTSERAVDILRTASATSHMRLLIARDDDARREFSELLEKFGSQSNTGSARSSPILHGGSRYLESTSSGSSSRSQSPLLLSPANSHGPFIGNPVHPSHAHYSIESGIQSISIAKSSGLGLTISGGSNRPDGPMIYVQELMPDGDCYKVLQYLGLDVTEEKKRQLRQTLTTDSQGTVAYGDLLQALRDVMQEELDEAGLDSSSMLFTQHEVASLLDTSAFHSPTFDSPNCNGTEELEQLQLEMMDLRQEVRRLKSLLKEVENSKKSMEDELQRLNQKALGFLSENRTLHSKLQMAEVVQRQAHSAEQDYEEVIHLLEAEIAELKMQLAGKKAKHASEIE